MPTRKQRRKRQKELRHEWEEVYVDEEGRELAPDEVEELVPPAKAKANGARRKPAASRGPAKGGSARPARSLRPMQPPSWRRVLKRGAIFAPLMYIFIALTSRDTTAAANLVMTAYLMLIFLPFSYLMDNLTYRLWKKRQAKTG